MKIRANVYNSGLTLLDCTVESVDRNVEEVFDYEHTDMYVVEKDGHTYYVPAASTVVEHLV